MADDLYAVVDKSKKKSLSKEQVSETQFQASPPVPEYSQLYNAAGTTFNEEKSDKVSSAQEATEEPATKMTNTKNCKMLLLPLVWCLVYIACLIIVIVVVAIVTLACLVYLFVEVAKIPCVWQEGKLVVGKEENNVHSSLDQPTQPTDHK